MQMKSNFWTCKAMGWAPVLVNCQGNECHSVKSPVKQSAGLHLVETRGCTSFSNLNSCGTLKRQMFDCFQIILLRHLRYKHIVSDNFFLKNVCYCHPEVSFQEEWKCMCKSLCSSSNHEVLKINVWYLYFLSLKINK